MQVQQQQVGGGGGGTSSCVIVAVDTVYAVNGPADMLFAVH
ncbi:hypothetical protein CGMCC3_g6852 [Colletotrichum fructicola]|nr:uncharacterized protein CGMCC3_g6852 [Colletotrichum fructicola]KAE9577162.1 hypothetical protein CGMCC3_g6852 [Colletotrichum fructicola]